MIISIIVAVSTNGIIGKDNGLLWKQSADLKRFKQLTSGHSIIMGRKTYDSIGKPLPNRRNIILTHQQHLAIPGCEVVNSIDEAIALCKDEEEVFIIGGGDIYKQFLVCTNRIYLTRIHHSFPGGDTFFPELHFWGETEREDFEADDKNEYPYSFITYQ